MSEQTVDTEGYGLSLVLNGYHSMSDDDGDATKDGNHSSSIIQFILFLC